MASNKQVKPQAFFLTAALVVVIAIFVYFASAYLFPYMPLIPVSRMAACDCFLYFAYGSNLLTKRIHINNPSAKMVAVGKLKDYRLDFNLFSQKWKGAVATIVEAPGDHVYGIVWEINKKDLANLDRQEGVSQGIYQVLEVEVETGNGQCVTARSYQITRPLGENCHPSAVYMDVIISGAHENGLPEEYIKFLEQIEHNDFSGKVDLSLDHKKQPAQPAQ